MILRMGAVTVLTGGRAMFVRLGLATPLERTGSMDSTAPCRASVIQTTQRCKSPSLLCCNSFKIINPQLPLMDRRVSLQARLLRHPLPSTLPHLHIWPGLPSGVFCRSSLSPNVDTFDEGVLLQKRRVLRTRRWHVRV